MEDQKGKKGIAALILAKAKPEKEESEEMDGMSVAVEDMMVALDQKDPEMFKAALNAFLDHR